MEIKYTHLYSIIEIVCLDNNIPFTKPFEEWGIDIDFAKLEELVKSLTDDEKELLAAGEDTEMKKFVKQYGLEEVDEFLYKFFNGEFGEGIYKMNWFQMMQYKQGFYNV